mgnify:CR=1 FL=1
MIEFNNCLRCGSENIDKLKDLLLEYVTTKNINNNSLVLTNTRHIDALKKAVAENDNVKMIYTIPTWINIKHTIYFVNVYQ